MSYTMKQQSLNQKSTKRRCPLIGCLCFFPFLLIGLVLLAIGALFYDQFDDFFNENVQKQMIISDQSNWWYSKWLKPEIEETLNIYIFEVINTKALRKNWLDPIASKSNPIKPHVRQIGPFVFRVQRTKENVEFVDPAKKQISYIERVRYYFDEFASSNQLDHSALNPFIRLIIKRAQAVARISGRLRSTIDEMINIYIDNVFIDRPVWRLIFGPLFKSEFESNNETSDEMNDLFDDNSLEKEFSMNEEQMKNIETLFSQTSLSSSNQTELIAKYNDLLKKSQPKNFSKQLKQSSNDREEAINKILKLFDQVEPFFKKLGVDINPYELLIGSYRFENQNGQIWLVKSNQSSQQNFEKDSLRKDFLENLTDRNSFKENSVFRFFTNNSKSKYKITTGLENRTTAQILEWNDSDRLNSWYGDNCNRIKGTDGHQYHTFLSRQNFNTDDI
ncbi:CD36-like protein 3 [Sarcoptes scabiei]|uniref:CD36-like protein 3 n=1 Tax=Sarcoptes scabiei TaxID=52283 RepID=A0A132A2Q6_SARSC|nr:CD36-like protein 3 [Sarcoptes scabiei]